MRTAFSTSAIGLLVAACSAPLPESDAGPQPDAGPRADADARVAPVPLIDHDRWLSVAATDDPFDDRPPTVDCEQGTGWAAEPLDGVATIGVDMNNCNYFTASQPLLLDVSAGDTIGVRAWHYALTGSGEAHLALRIGDELIFERHVPIPADSQLIVDNVVAPRAFHAGDRVLFHAHNHGENTYNLIDVVRGTVE